MLTLIIVVWGIFEAMPYVFPYRTDVKLKNNGETIRVCYDRRVLGSMWRDCDNWGIQVCDFYYVIKVGGKKVASFQTYFFGEGSGSVRGIIDKDEAFIENDTLNFFFQFDQRCVIQFPIDGNYHGVKDFKLITFVTSEPNDTVWIKMKSGQKRIIGKRKMEVPSKSLFKDY